MLLLILALAVGWLLAGTLTWLLYRLMMDRGRLLLQVEFLERRVAEVSSEPEVSDLGLPIGAPAPDFELSDLEGAQHALSSWRGSSVVLVFFDPECNFCRQMVPDLTEALRDRTAGDPLPVIVTSRGRDANRDLLPAGGLNCPILVQENAEVAWQFRAFATPSAHLVDERGSIKSELALGAEAVLALLGEPPVRTSDGRMETAEGHAPLQVSRKIRALADSKLNRSGLPTGTPAPAFSLPRLDGGELSLAEYEGRRVLLVFSDPECTPCTTLAPKLEQIHQNSEAPQVLMISRGTPEANRAKADEFELTFPIALQRHWEISRAYGMFATPIAYLIDERGVISADVAVGNDAILHLVPPRRNRKFDRKEAASVR